MIYPRANLSKRQTTPQILHCLTLGRYAATARDVPPGRGPRLPRSSPHVPQRSRGPRARLSGAKPSGSKARRESGRAAVFWRFL